MRRMCFTKRATKARPCAISRAPAACRWRAFITISNRKNGCSISSRSTLSRTIVERLQATAGRSGRSGARVRVFILNHLEYFLANQKAMKVLSHEDEVLKNGYRLRDRRASSASTIASAWSCWTDSSATAGLEFSSRIAVLSLFGMMNWIYTWYNPRVDGDADRNWREKWETFFCRASGQRHAKPRKKDLQSSEIDSTIGKGIDYGDNMQPTSGEATKQLSTTAWTAASR